MARRAALAGSDAPCRSARVAIQSLSSPLWRKATRALRPGLGTLGALALAALGFFFLPLLGLGQVRGLVVLVHSIPEWGNAALGGASANPLFFSAPVPLLLSMVGYRSPPLRGVLAGLAVGYAAVLLARAFFWSAAVALLPPGFAPVLWLAPAPRARLLVGKGELGMADVRSELGPDLAACSRTLHWSAVLGGSFTAMGVWLFLLALGAALQSGAGVTAWTAIYNLVSPIIALFFGGLVASRSRLLTSRFDGTLHGVVIWGFTMSIGALLLSCAGSGRGRASNIEGRAQTARAGSPEPDYQQLTPGPLVPVIRWKSGTSVEARLVDGAESGPHPAAAFARRAPGPLSTTWSTSLDAFSGSSPSAHSAAGSLTRRI
jgi:hypothetical protein